MSYLPHWRPIARTVPVCRTVDAFRRSMLTVGLRGRSQQFTALFLLAWRRTTVMKIVIVAGATLALVTAAGAADLPHPQPVYQTAQVGKMPIGKGPIGKSPIGKSPVVTRTY